MTSSPYRNVENTEVLKMIMMKKNMAKKTRKNNPKIKIEKMNIKKKNQHMILCRKKALKKSIQKIKMNNKIQKKL